MSAVGEYALVAGAPGAQRLRPFVRPPQLVDLVTRLDQAAVHGARRDRRIFVVDRAQHGFVEQAQAARGVGTIDARAPFEGQRHRDEIGFGEASTDLRRTFGQAAGVREVTTDDALERDGSSM